MGITSGEIKKLREATGAGMMSCKEALKETSGDFEAAIDYLRKKGLAMAQKKQSRVAAEGAVHILLKDNKAVMVEVNCETDFVAKGDDFKSFTKNVAEYILENNLSDISQLKEAKSSDVSDLTIKCGEKIDIRRFVNIDTNGCIGHYNHGGRIGILVDIEGANKIDSELDTFTKDISMHIAASDPQFIAASDIDDNYKKREEDIYVAQLKAEGKPDKIIPKIVMGKLNKLSSSICLLEQPYVKDPDIKVKKYVEDFSKKHNYNIVIKRFYRMNLGDEIEKKQDNLAEEVAKMTKGH